MCSLDTYSRTNMVDNFVMKNLNVVEEVDEVTHDQPNNHNNLFFFSSDSFSFYSKLFAK